MANDKTYDRHVNIWINGKEVKNDIKSIENELAKLNVELSDTTKGTKEYNEKAAEIRKLKGILSEHVNDIASVKKEMLRLTNELARTTRGTEEYNEKAGRIRYLKGILKEHQENITSTTTGWEKAKKIFSGAQGIFIAGLGAITAGYQGLKGIIEATDNLSDKFAATLGGVKEGFFALKQAIATGDFTNFFKNLADAYSEGRKYAETLDAIGDSARALSLEESKAADRILELKLIQIDARKSREEQIKAGEEIERIQSDLADKRVVQARKNLDNELSLARDRSKLTDEEIRGLLNQDEAYMSLLGTGQKYIELQTKLKLMQAGTVTPYGTVMSASQDEIRAVAREIEGMGMAGEYAARVYVGWGNVIEGQREKLVQYETDVATAKRSATEDIIRNITRLNTARAVEVNEVRKNVEKIKEYYTKYGLDNATAVQGNAAYDPQEWMRIEEAELRQKAEQEREKEIEELQRHEQRKQDIYLETLEQGTAKAKEEFEKRKQDEQDWMYRTVELYKEYGRQVGEILGEAIADGDSLLKAAAKAALNVAFEELRRLAKVWEAQIFAKSILAYGPIAGTFRAAAATALIEATIAGAEAVVMKNLWTGGYTGTGGKYEPRGIVHAGEWVANADMVASPTYGPVIRALEGAQQSRRGFAEGGFSGGSASGSTAAGFLADPETKGLIREMKELLKALRNEGVKTVWGWSDVNKARQGMQRLEQIEDNVSID